MGLIYKKDERRKQFEQQQTERAEYLKAHAVWLASAELKAAPTRLAATLRDLRRRGLVQVGEGGQAHYDLHPVVRGIVSGALAGGETERLGQRVVDHFSNRAHNPYEQADSLHDLAEGFHVVRTLLRMGRFEWALDAWRGDLNKAALFNVQAYAEILALLRPFFPQGWLQPPAGLDDSDDNSFLMNEVAMALDETGLRDQAIQLYGATLRLDAACKNGRYLRVGLSNLADALRSVNRMADASTCVRLALRCAEASKDDAEIFSARLDCFDDASVCGDWERADAHWGSLDDMGRDWSRAIYRPGDAECQRAVNLWYRGLTPKAALDAAEPLARGSRNRDGIRRILQLRGEWHLATGDARAAITALDESAQLARASSRPDLDTEAWLALARQQAGQLADPHAEAIRLDDAGARGWPMAKLWQAADVPARARQVALDAYRWAWSDGEPYIRRLELERARTLLIALSEPVPELPPYDAARRPRFDWQDEVEAALTAIEEANAEKAAAEEEKAKQEGLKPS